MSETWIYNPEAGRWPHDRPPTRAEAVKLAAECASASCDTTIPPEAGIAKAHSAHAWAAVAAVADRDETAFPAPVPPAAAPPTPTLVNVGSCVHGRTAMRILPDGSWLHIPSLGPCNQPPLYAVEVR